MDEMLDDLGIESVAVDRPLAREAAAVRLRTGLKLPDAYALATAIHMEKHAGTDVRVESFDAKVREACEALRSD